MLVVWIYVILQMTFACFNNKCGAQKVYLEYQNSHVIGGRLKGRATNQAECVHACQAAITCYAIDYDATARSCWFHGTTAICRKPIPRLGATHVKLVQCLNPSYSYQPSAGQVAAPFTGRHVVGGLYISGVGNVYQCLKSCVHSCRAVDFDTADNSCWHHVDTAVCAAPLAVRTGSTHYRLPHCPSQAVFKHTLHVPHFSPVPVPVSTGVVPYQPTLPVMVHSLPEISLPLSLQLPAPPLPLLLQATSSLVHSRTSIGGPLPTSCGQPAFSPMTGRIVGGDTARPHSWPWQVALRNRKSRSVRCAGSLIAPQLVLTTAHCVDEDLVGTNWLVYSGGHDLLQFESMRTTHTVAKVILHEHFDLNTFDNDVALLVLGSPVKWNEYVNPVCLPPPGFELAPDTRCVITGWGVSENGKRPLNQASIPIIAMEKCKQKDWLGAEFTLTQRMMCAGYPYGGVDTCQGDSGGPLVCYINSRWVQMGVTSFGRGCGLPKKPGVYSKVSHFVDWIQLKARTL